MHRPTRSFTGRSPFGELLIVAAVLGLPPVLRAGESPLFGEPQVLFEAPTRVMRAVLTSDELTLYYSDLPLGDAFAGRIWEARRTELTDPFGTPTRLGPVVNRGDFTMFPYLSADDRFPFFSVGHVPENA